MGAVKVNNDDVWNEYVKTGKVKGFSIEGYFADKMERPQDNTTGLSEEEKADLLLSQITSIVKGEKVELNAINDLAKLNNLYYKNTADVITVIKKMLSDGRNAESKLNEAIKSADTMETKIKKYEQQIKELGVPLQYLDNNSVYQSSKGAIKEAKEFKSTLKILKDFITTI